MGAESGLVVEVSLTATGEETLADDVNGHFFNAAGRVVAWR